MGAAGVGGAMSLAIVPCSRKQANDFIRLHHRHHRPTPGDKFCIGAADDGRVCGVAVVAHPVARALMDGKTLEVRRVATDGTKNACSLLYSACRRAAFAIGYTRLLTYTLPEEGGASLRASGWECDGERASQPWTFKANGRRGRKAHHAGPANDWPTGAKVRWHTKRDGWPGELAWPESEEASPQGELFTEGVGMTRLT